MTLCASSGGVSGIADKDFRVVFAGDECKPQ
jgi:hypothetical protein